MKNKSDPVTLALLQVAEKNHTTVEEVKREITLAIQLAVQSPAAGAVWWEMPYTGSTPTPEEVIAYVVGRIRRET